MLKSWCQMEINNIIQNLLFRYPLFGNIIVNLDIKYTTEKVPAPAFTDGKTIYYKDEFLTDFDDEEKVFIIAHEIFHIILSHLFRNIGRDRDLLNYVEDAIINQLLVKDGLKMPTGLVEIEDALDYSTEELYMKLLPEMQKIKNWMGANTYHIDLSGLGDILGETIERIKQNSYQQDLQDLMSSNQKMRNEAFEAYSNELKFNFEKAKQQSFGALPGEGSDAIKFPAVALGAAEQILDWQDILESNLKLPDEDATCFYEVQMDGIIKKETKYVEVESESEIIVDSSGSMNMNKIKIILRECKNILLCSKIKVGFCDTEFYGWNEIYTQDSIDDLQIIGRGGTDFETMANSFTDNVDNKIVITDGMDRFPVNRPDILWVIIGYEQPPFLNKYYRDWLYKDFDEKSIRYIFIDEKELVQKQNKTLTLKKTPSKQ